jgi:hypothetical protein
MADPISVSGKWLLPDGRIVDQQPEEGRLLVAAGSPITPDVKESIERAEAAAPATADQPADDGEKADEKPADDADEKATEDDNTVTTSATARQRKR